MQSCISSLEACRKPVLAAVHSACVGAGVDLISAADMRYCTKDAWFQVKEVSINNVLRYCVRNEEEIEKQYELLFNQM